jgi:uncharacterized protein (DUF3820 family)
MPFGKYKGRLLTELPRDYKIWVAENLNGEIAEFCRLLILETTNSYHLR